MRSCAELSVVCMDMCEKSLKVVLAGTSSLQTETHRSDTRLSPLYNITATQLTAFKAKSNTSHTIREGEIALLPISPKNRTKSCMSNNVSPTPSPKPGRRTQALWCPEHPSRLCKVSLHQSDPICHAMPCHINAVCHARMLCNCKEEQGPTRMDKVR